MALSMTDWLWAIPVFGLLIFIHELGHFSVAKFFDVRVHEFALGFGPRVAGLQRGETKYSLRLVPLGGFVRMAGMEEGDSEDPRGFNRQSVMARALIIVAGPVMNFVLAALMYSTMLAFVGQASNLPVLGEMTADCGALMGAGVSRPCPAFAAGLQEGDRVLSVGGKEVTQWPDIRGGVIQSEGKPLIFQVQRGQATREISVTPIFLDGQWVVGIQQSLQPEPLGRALLMGPVVTARISAMWLMGLKEMIVGNIKPQLSGPVGITREIAEQAAQGWENLLRLTAFLSINLGMFNLLPIPALDGSRLLFMVVETVRGRRLDPQRENFVHFVGFLILVGLMMVITYGEVIRR